MAVPPASSSSLMSTGMFCGEYLAIVLLIPDENLLSPLCFCGACVVYQIQPACLRARLRTIHLYIIVINEKRTPVDIIRVISNKDERRAHLFGGARTARRRARRDRRRARVERMDGWIGRWKAGVDFGGCGWIGGWRGWGWGWSGRPGDLAGLTHLHSPLRHLPSPKTLSIFLSSSAHTCPCLTHIYHTHLLPTSALQTFSIMCLKDRTSSCFWQPHPRSSMRR